MANTGVEPPFPKINQLKYWIHAGQVKRKVDCSKFSPAFNSIKIVAHKEKPALQQDQIQEERWIPSLRGLFSKSPAERHAKQEFDAL